MTLKPHFLVKIARGEGVADLKSRIFVTVSAGALQSRVYTYNNKVEITQADAQRHLSPPFNPLTY